MNVNNSEEIHDKIDDYILGLLPESEQADIKALIMSNPSYGQYHTEQKELIELSQAFDVPDPGPEFWQSFPDQVLSKSKQASNEKPESLWCQIANWWNNQSLQLQILQPAIALTLLVGLFSYLQQNNTSLYSPLADQQIIWQTSSSGTDMLQPMIPDKTNSYGFTANNSVSLFSAGQHYSLSIAYFIRQQYADSKQQINTLNNLNIQRSLNSLIEHLNSKNIDSVIGFELYENINSELKMTLSRDEHALFSAGSWLKTVEVALQTQQYQLFNELNHTDQILPGLQSQALPESLYHKFEKLDQFLDKKQHDRKDVKEIQRLITNIQHVLN